MNSRFKIYIQDGRGERWADADKVFAHLMKIHFEKFLNKFFPKALFNYTKAELGGKNPEPYKDKINNFFDQAGEKWDEWITALKKAYPNIDVDKELSRAKMWLLSNPKQAKSNFSKYVNNWMSREMEKTIKPDDKERVMFGEY